MSNETWNEICGTVLKQQQEINELKAMVNALSVSLDMMRSRPYDEGDFVKMSDIALLTIQENPKQCLANVKADAIDELAMHIGLTGKALSNYVNNLRKTMITTSPASSLSEVVNKINEEL